MCSPVGGQTPGERVGWGSHRHEIVGDEDTATAEAEVEAEVEAEAEAEAEVEVEVEAEVEVEWGCVAGQLQGVSQLAGGLWHAQATGHSHRPRATGHGPQAGGRACGRWEA